jgi:hypothetical protein
MASLRRAAYEHKDLDSWDPEIDKINGYLAVLLSDKNPKVRGEAFESLSSMSGRPSNVLPIDGDLVQTFVMILKDRNWRGESQSTPMIGRDAAALALERLGPYAIKAFPALLEIWNAEPKQSGPTPNPVSSAIARALQKIDPVAAAKAGVK